MFAGCLTEFREKDEKPSNSGWKSGSSLKCLKWRLNGMINPWESGLIYFQTKSHHRQSAVPVDHCSAAVDCSYKPCLSVALQHPFRDDSCWKSMATRRGRPYLVWSWTLRHEVPRAWRGAILDSDANVGFSCRKGLGRLLEDTKNHVATYPYKIPDMQILHSCDVH